MKTLNKEKRNKLIMEITFLLFIIIMNISFYTKFVSRGEALDIGDKLQKGKVIYLILSIVVSIIISLLVLFINKKKEIKPEKAFIILALVLGIINMFATPLLRGHDEEYHWYKSYAVSMGQFFQIRNEDGYKGDNLPKKVNGIYQIQGQYSDIDYESSNKAWSYARDEEQSNEEQFTYNEPTSMYPPIQMIPQGIGILLARTIGLDVYAQGMFGRLGNLIFFIIMGYFAIKILPTKKYFLLILLLCPKVLYISSTMSGDVFVNMTTILFTSYIFKLREEKKLLNKKDIAILLTLIPCIAISKLVYFAICALVLLIPQECFKNKKSRIAFIGLVLAVMVEVMVIWVGVADLTHRAIRPTLQREWIFTHPISYLGVLVRGVMTNFSNWTLDMVGGAMAWHSDVNEPEMLSIIVCVLLFLSLFKDDKKEEKYKTSEYIVIIGIALTVIATIITALYLEWTAKEGIGVPNITGVQGRYFTPLALLLTTLIPVKHITIKKKIDVRWFYIIMILIQLPTILNMFIYYV